MVCLWKRMHGVAGIIAALAVFTVSARGYGQTFEPAGL